MFSRAHFKRIGRLACVACQNRHRLDLDRGAEASIFDMKVRRQMIVGVDRNLAICETADRRHLWRRDNI
jgi:hypothetical protein